MKWHFFVISSAFHNDLYEMCIEYEHLLAKFVNKMSHISRPLILAEDWTLCGPSFTIPFAIFMSWIYLSGKCVCHSHKCTLFTLHLACALSIIKLFSARIIQWQQQQQKKKTWNLFAFFIRYRRMEGNRQYHYSHLRLRIARGAHTNFLWANIHFGCIFIRLICCLHLDVPWAGFFCFSRFAPQAFFRITLH